MYYFIEQLLCLLLVIVCPHYLLIPTLSVIVMLLYRV